MYTYVHVCLLNSIRARKSPLLRALQRRSNGSGTLSKEKNKLVNTPAALLLSGLEQFITKKQIMV